MTTMNIETITLSHGAHRSRDAGTCAMEAVAWLAGEPHSDSPACTCPVVAAFVRRTNDRLRDDEERTRYLRPLLPVLIGTRTESREVMQRRAYLAADWAVRTCVPTLLRALGRDEWAARLEACAQVVDRETALAARAEARDVRAAAYASDAAYAAAYAAADAAYAADATYAAYAAYAAAYAAADAAAAADADARKVALDEVRDQINASAVDLVRRMCEVRPEPLEVE